MKHLFLLIFIALFTINLFTQTPIAPAAGNGSESNPYQIASLENLYWIAASDAVVSDPDQAARWSSHYLQVANIDASDTVNWFAGSGWSPIGYFSIRFTGSYRGEDHTIEGIYINRPATGSIGLFGYAQEASIRNLSLIDINVHGLAFTGGLIGFDNDSEIVNCHITGEVSGVEDRIGGLVGRGNYTTISNSSFTGNVEGHDDIGGLIGRQDDSIISGSYNTGNIVGNENIGGLVGIGNRSEISNCSNTGSVEGNVRVGGLAGVFLNLPSLIIYSYNTGEISGNYEVGGIVGRCQSPSDAIIKCYNTGIVTGGEMVGGLTGYVSAISTISDSYNSGTVTGGDYVAGLVGHGGHTTLNNCYNTGFIEGENYTGGIIGHVGSGSVNNSYYDFQTSGQTDTGNGEPRSTEDMTYPYTFNTYVGWDFLNTWFPDINHNVNYGYPYLYDVPVSVDDDVIEVVEAISLSNYPNPFNPETTIRYVLPHDVVLMELNIYNIRGQLVRTLIPQKPHPAGEYQIVWDGKSDLGSSLPSGIYFYQITTSDQNKINKMLLLK